MSVTPFEGVRAGTGAKAGVKEGRKRAPGTNATPSAAAAATAAKPTGKERKPLLEVTDLDVAYGQVVAIRGLTMSVAEGEMIALVGANGAGKSTTLRAISGLAPARRGSIRFAGEEMTGRSAHRIVRAGIAHVPEGRDLFPTLSVTDNLRAGYWTRRSEKSGVAGALDRVMAYFPKLRQRAEQAAGTLSGGEQQMLAVARALMSSPKLLLVDELSFGLAPMIVEQLFAILREVNQAGTSVLLVEQFVHMALDNTDRAYVLAKGELRAEGESRLLLADDAVMGAYLGTT